MRARIVAACLKDQIPADIPCHYVRFQGSTMKAADCVDRTDRMQGIGWLSSRCAASGMRGRLG
jgi:hypothetical protein